jgi:guanylate kinase
MNKIFCLVGPSGTGKDTIKDMIPIPHLVSYRTRAKRDHEVDGVHGHFITNEEYFKMKRTGAWAAETEYPKGSNCYYGVLWEQLESLRKHPLLYVVDWNGVITLRESFSKKPGWSPDQVVSIYIDSDIKNLERRMRKQGRSEEEIQQRLVNIYKMDLPARKLCDYIVVNREYLIKDTVNEVQEIILKELFGDFKVGVSA